MTETAPVVTWFETWRREQLSGARFSCRPIRWSDSQDWSLVDGRWAHASGGFFSVVGVRTQANDPRLDGCEQPILDQRTPAVIGLALSIEPDGVWLLFQGRIEPGNVGGLQLAPTVQSTKANYTRLHGGRPTSYLDLFVGSNRPPLHDSLQSEEGSRYFAKYNRTLVVDTSLDRQAVADPRFRWLGLQELRLLSAHSHCINTDARSVLSLADWDLLAQPRRAFEDGTADGAALRRSFEARWLHRTYREVAQTLAHWRIRANIHHELVPIRALSAWRMNDEALHGTGDNPPFTIRQYRIHAANREVTTWDQPLVDSRSSGRIVLVGQQRDGVWQFWIRAAFEPGLADGVALSASYVLAPGAPDSGGEGWRVGGPGVRILAALQQSEEGGRFHQDVNAYAVVIAPPDLQGPDDHEGFWLTLGEVKDLMESPGICAIELRCVCSLLLRFL